MASGAGSPERPGAVLAGARGREDLDNAAGAVALAGATIHSPRRCGTPCDSGPKGVSPLTISLRRRSRGDGHKTRMKLTRLRLIGFKSFVEPTDFEIEPGLTGVVGPNGCGKSNLVEAVRWVMGEASYKAMRASEMDDVIFSGNTDRPARNHAEVAVVGRQQRPQGAGRIQRCRDARSLAPHHARARLDVPRQRPRGARPRRHRAVRRRLDRLALAGPGASGPHRRDHPGAARPAPPRARRGGRHFRTACPPPRGGAAAQGRRAQPRPGRRRHRPACRAGRRAQDPGAAGGALPQHFRTGAPDRSAAVPSALDRRRKPKSAEAERGQRRGGRASSPRAPASRRGATTRQADVAAGLPALREAEAKAAAALQRLLIAREALEREEARAKERIGELDRRLEQFAADLAARADACRRRRGRARTARRRGESAQGRSAGKRRAAQRRQRPRRRGGRGARRVGKVLCRIDRRARRSDGAAQSASGGVARSRAARGAARSRARQHRGRPCRDRQRRAGSCRRWRRRSPPRRPRSTKRRAPRGGGSRARARARTNSTPRARRSPPPSAACSGWKPKPRPSASCWRSKTRISGRR